MLVELTDKEVRMVGEQRWLMSCWKRAFAGLVAWTVLCLLSRYMLYVAAESWLRLVVLAVVAIIGVVYFVWYMRKYDKAGKRLLHEQRYLEVKNETQT